MPSYVAPVDDTLFVLDVLGFADHAELPGFEDATPDLVAAILEEGGKFCAEQIQPLNQIGDKDGCTRGENGAVSAPKGFKEAYEAYAEAGWVGLSADPAYGGQGLPFVLATAMNEFTSAANMAWSMYPGLTQGAIAAITQHGSDEQKALYLTKLASGRWTGTMNLTEPHCGTDLGLIRTKAAPAGDGSYRITGTKIFISAGDHDMAENIVHLVLARIEGAPEGTKGISLFVVPKVMAESDGTLGAANAVTCGALEEKMGIHGNATCVMNFDGATGWLIGEENKGLRAMFTMMNEARLGVATQGLAQSEVAYQNAAAYAKDRLQGRALTGAKNPDGPADPIIVHPDVRRMLLRIKAFNEAARALLLWASLKADISRRSADEKEATAAEDAVGLLTPVLKGVLTDTGFDNAVMAQQVFGGHGYIAEWGMEQFVRDARIAMIYEGANGIQALDLVGRKLGANGGRAVMAFFAEVGGFLQANAENADLAPYLAPLQKGAEELQKATMWFMNNAMKAPDNAGAGSVAFMHLFGLVALGYMWARMAKVAQEKLAAGAEGRDAYYEAKLLTGRFFMEQMMPETAVHLARVTAGAETVMAMPVEAF
ncbi:MAG: acyl-CoA dehydrogenase [Hyphomicrobiales bacterium]|mgnify:CR=1 FL=1|nr:MAG: acyl-CoA dehydrogenase [Hyphomicrobiales bacterium]